MTDLEALIQFWELFLQSPVVTDQYLLRSKVRATITYLEELKKLKGE